MSAWRSEFYHVFSIAEIAIQIVELFDLDSNPDDVGAITNSRATLAALARVCTVTSAPALDYLWSILDHLGPLVRLLPREAYTDDRKEIKIVRLPGPEDLLKFDKYAIRVKHLRSFDPAIGSALSIWRSPILPSIRSLASHALPSPRIGLMSLQLRSFRWFVRAPSKEPKQEAAFFRRLPSSCPELEELYYLDGPLSDDNHFNEPFASFAIYDALVHAIKSLPRLTRFECEFPMPTSESITHLSQCTRLSHLKFRINAEHEDPRPVYGHGAFRALTDLVVRSTGNFAVDLLSAVNHDLKRLELHLTDEELDPTFVVSKIVASTSPHILLRVLCLGMADIDATEGYNLTSLLPLRAFTRLETLEVDWLCVNVDDHNIDLVTKPMPSLRALTICPARGNAKPLLTRRGLIHLTENCPKLEKISLEVDFSAHEEDALPSPLIPSQITRLEIFGSLPGDPDRTAGLIQTVFPSLRGISGYESYSSMQYRRRVWHSVVGKLGASGMEVGYASG